MSSPDFVQTLKYYRDLVWPEIDSYLLQLNKLPAYCAIPTQYQNLLDFHIKMVRDYPERKGKYLRPTLLCLTAESLGVPFEKVLKTAAAMQLSEEWILLHDDIEDDSKERRGAPALHQIYGKELSINAGDHLQSLQWRILFDNYSILGNDLASRIKDEFMSMFDRTFLGQTIEIKWNQDSEIILSEEDVLLTLESKTGYYTIAGPMRLGAILAGASQAQLESIYKFGVLLGRVFQITDDILDLTSDFSGLKKQQGNDIYENKKTIMFVHLIRSVSGDDKVRLGLILAKNRYQKTSEEVEYVIGLMEKHGSIEYARQLARKYSEECRLLFKELNFLSRQPYRSQLEAGIDFILNRQH